MVRVLAIEPAVLLHLDALTVVDLVLHRDVVTPLALLAREGHLDALFIPCHIYRRLSVCTATALARGPRAPPSSGGGTRTLDNTIMSRVL
mgnify:CR=1 FL=1